MWKANMTRLSEVNHSRTCIYILCTYQFVILLFLFTLHFYKFGEATLAYSSSRKIRCLLWRLKMKIGGYAAISVIMVVVVVAMSEAQQTEAVTCSPLELSSCLSAITSSSPPTGMCCSKLKEQKPCLCGYLRNPNFSQYVNSPNARKVANACGVPFPNC